MTQTLASNVNSDIPGVAPNDLYLDTFGNIALSFDQQALLEQCSQVARVLLGEMIFNTDQGVPYFETVWGGVTNIAQFNASLRTSFLNVEGVVEVVSLESEKTGDVLTYTAVIRTIFGTGVING